jgi:FkbM family methyltransferase
MLCKTIVPNSTILDIGGGCGIHSITFARIDRSIRVHTFEPAINTYNTLIHNVERNGVAGQVTCHNIALSDNCENLYISNRYGPTDHVVKNMNDIRLDKANEIKSTTVDDFVFKNSLSVDGIKIDVEGFEYYVLKGAAKTIFKDKPWIYLEAIPSHLKRYYLELNDLYEILSSYGYELFWVDPTDAQLITYSDFPHDICNLFCSYTNMR